MDRRIRVLLADDEKPFVRNLARLLRDRHFDVDTAFDGIQAIEKVKQDDLFHVVVLDIKMPFMDGIAALKEIKRISPTSEILMLTGNATLDSGIQAMREGAFDYLLKPCDIEVLSEKIEAAFEVEKIKRQPVLWPRRLVKETCDPTFVRLEADDPIQKVLDIFSRKPGMVVKETLYVLDHDNRLNGTVTKRDLVDAVRKSCADNSLTWEDVSGKPECLPDMTVRQIMRLEQPLFADPDDDLFETARRMIAGGVRCMPVVKNGTVSAVVRLKDVLKHIENEMA